MPEPTDRERGINAYAAEVRNFHRFFTVVLIGLLALHMLLLRPFVQVRGAMPVIAARITDTEQQVTATEEAEKAATAAAGALMQFRRAMQAGPEELGRVVGNLVTRGREVVGPGGDPYKTSIRLPKEGAPPASGTPSVSGTPSDESISVEEAIRQQIGRQVEALSLSLDAAMDPLRSLKDPPPEIQDALKVAQEDLGRNVLALNEVLRDAFANAPSFWQKLNGGATFGAASPRALEVTRSINQSLRALDSRLGSASAMRSRQQVLQARLAALQATQHELGDRLAALGTRLGWIPLSPEEWIRLFPILAGVVALTVLFRLRRILHYRKALGGVDLDLTAPSWIVGSPTSPGRWWAVLLIALPLIETVYASYNAMVDPGLSASILGDSSVLTIVGFWAIYAALIGGAIIQFYAVARGLVVAPPKRAEAQARRATGG